MSTTGGGGVESVRRLAGTALVVAALTACATGERPTGNAEWIWPRDADATAGRPAAYLLLVDFEVPAGAGTAGARLFVAADAEYAVHLNGPPIARGVFRLGEPIDEFEVGRLLREGVNRLALDVRVPHGDGAALAGIELSDGTMPVVSDAAWRFSRAWRDDLVEGREELTDAGLGRVRSWGRPPIGRWGPISRGAAAEPEGLRGTSRPRRVIRTSTAPGLGLAPRDRVAHRIDFGDEVTGILELDLPPVARAALHRVRYCLAHRCASRPLVRFPGRTVWRDATPRTFDSVLVISPGRLRDARVRR